MSLTSSTNPSENGAWEHLESLVAFLLDVGIPVGTKPSGQRFPSQRQTWIGWVFDTVAGSISVEAAELHKTVSAIDQTLTEDDARQLDSKLLSHRAGLLSHIGEIDMQIHRRLRSVWSDLNAAGVYHMWQHPPSSR